MFLLYFIVHILICTSYTYKRFPTNFLHHLIYTYNHYTLIYKIFKPNILVSFICNLYITLHIYTFYIHLKS